MKSGWRGFSWVGLQPDGCNGDKGWEMPVWLVEVMERYHRLALLPALVLLSMFVWGGNQPEAAGLIPPPWDKLAHLAWFAVLAGLLHVGLGLRRGVWRQLSLPGRAAGWDDLLFDGLGVGVGIWLAGIASPRSR